MFDQKLIIKKIIVSLYNLIKKFGFFMQKIINFILLLPVYFLGVGGVAIFSKLVNKHYLPLRKTKYDSYWLKRDKRLDKKGNEYRMF